MSKHHRSDRGRFMQQEQAKNTAAEQRARQALRDLHSIAAKARGKTQKATVKHRGKG